MIAYEERPPTVAEFNALRESVGWGAIRPLPAAERAIKHSLYFVKALHAGRVVGVARIIGDGGNAFYVQDVIVHPEYQHQGIGTALMDRVMAFLQTIESDMIMVCLMSAKGKEPFYSKYGFIERPNPSFGAGMIRFLQLKRPAHPEHRVTR
ncbi:MAG: GNAT family N-acetyltransferase [Opitutaceae bacterium]|nr:GNAT family N-acetyltransferase [Opitutaceae bacterium]